MSLSFLGLVAYLVFVYFAPAIWFPWLAQYRVALTTRAIAAAIKAHYSRWTQGCLGKVTNEEYLASFNKHALTSELVDVLASIRADIRAVR